ncbi:pyridoxal phosphate-dependent transferase [Fimicolochytrium jonesii]|uniref:pyridoxal phosphate-dependent transferase n=1 Tax=Fimicolochytrium jonesii TaxID=1396493 RepID=UPI0022FF364C|nr:pyridoxal phosphate-dependent transferase [Fimicolochytrium jonesii]KAI8826011.1 pyridoxal phosphate-dependent transferase [Fimicolochytrium jonesii]
MASANRINQLSSHLSSNPHAAAMSSGDSAFTHVTQAPPDPILHLSHLHSEDTFEKRINVGVGAYRDENGKPWVLPVVRKAEKQLIQDPKFDHEYLPIDGLKPFYEASVRLILGKDSAAVKEKRYVGIQTISGSGAVRLGGAFLNRFRKAKIYVSNPTWGNHHDIFKDAELEVHTYPYWDPKTRGLALEDMLKSLKDAPNGSIIVLHPCAHNPTGVDPTPEQWRQIAAVLKEKSHFPFFDCAYQGFATGDLDRDASAVRYFVEQGFELLVCQSYSKNLGLYGERAGCLTVVLKSASVVPQVRSQLVRLQRAAISSPPAFGARVASLILNDETMFREWTEQLKIMSGRIQTMRKLLHDALIELKTPGTWNHITDQIGMFCYTGLSVKQVGVMKEKYHVYLTDNGRISVAGLNQSNVRTFAEALDWVVRNVN